MPQIVLKLVFLCKLVALFCYVSPAPIQDESLAEIRESKNSIDEKGNYVFSFDTTNGITRYEEGKVVNEGEQGAHIKITGYYSYIDDTGTRILINYTADENGYQAQKNNDIDDLNKTSLPTAIIYSLSG